MGTNGHIIDKDLIALTLEKVLRKIGEPEFDFVVTSLKNDFSCSLGDSLDSPTYLKIVLTDLFGNSYRDVIVAIQHELANVTKTKSIDDFIFALALK